MALGADPIFAIDGISRAAFRSFSTMPNARLVDEDGAFGVITEIPITFFNGIATSQLEPARVGRVIDTLRGAGRPFRWWISPSASPASLADLLLAQGMRHMYDSPGMTCDLTSLSTGAVPAGVSIEEVADLTHWLPVFLTGFERPPHERELWRTAYAQCEPIWTHFVAFVDEQPVATTSLLVRGELAGVYHVVTLAEHRGRGIGAAITRHALQHARDAGARVAALQASKLGFPVYRSVGFENACTLRMFDWRPEYELSP